MAKRFTDTDKFTDPWYRRLETKNKLLWDWMICSCDQAGFISIDFDFIEMILCEKFESSTIEKYFSDRVIRLGEFKYFIPKFIKFQYGKLNPNALVHKSVIKKLEVNGIDYQKIDEMSVMPERFYGHHNESERRSSSFSRVKEKDKDKDKDSSILSSSKNEPCEKDLSKENLKIDNVIQLFNDSLAGKGKIRHCRDLASEHRQEFVTTAGFKQFSEISGWVEVFKNVSESDFLKGLKTDFVASLGWLVVHKNALNVLNGQFNGTQNDQKAPKNGFKSKSNSTAATPQNPTGNPYIQEALEKGLIA